MDFTSVLELFHKRLPQILADVRASNSPLDRMFYNELIRVHALHEDIESAQNAFHEMQSSGIEPNGNERSNCMHFIKLEHGPIMS